MKGKLDRFDYDTHYPALHLRQNGRQHQLDDTLVSNLTATSGDLKIAAHLLSNGGLVAFPTETVYGLGADATDATAVARIFQAKERPSFNPLIVHVKDLTQAKSIGQFSVLAEKLAHEAWPGPLTIVVPRQPACDITELVSAGLDTIALRVPAHETAQALLAECNLPLAAPSANLSGSISPTTADHVRSSLGERIDAILDDGPCSVGLESTIVGFLDDHPTILRPGGFPRDKIEAIVGPCGEAIHATDKPLAPGQLKSHYAPACPVRLNATEVTSGEALLGFGEAMPGGAKHSLNLSPSGDLVEAAANLFAFLHRLEDSGPTAIAVMPIPDYDLGEAINDRLQRAAADKTE